MEKLFSKMVDTHYFKSLIFVKKFISDKAFDQFFGQNSTIFGSLKNHFTFVKLNRIFGQKMKFWNSAGECVANS